jgi:branched-chain amino acid transport system ATP-binding protein
MLEIRDLWVSYGVTEVLRGVSFRVPDGSIVALLGGNGSGKTTTLNTISGFLKPCRGAVELAGQRLNGRSTDAIVKLGLVQVPQGREVFARMSVAENLELGAVTRTDRIGIKRTLAEVYETFPHLYERRTQKAGTLSGGEQQMLAIARALMAAPHLLLMDEPSAGLAPLVVQEITYIIRRLNRQGKTILLVEQNVGAALSVAETAYVLRDGQIAIGDRAERLKANPEVVRSYLGG